MSLLDISPQERARLVAEYLTPDTPIPTWARQAIRSLVKGQSDFETWSCGLLESRDITNSQLIRYAREHPQVGLVVLDILTGTEAELLEKERYRTKALAFIKALRKDPPKGENVNG